MTLKFKEYELFYFIFKKTFIQRTFINGIELYYKNEDSPAIWDVKALDGSNTYESLKIFGEGSTDHRYFYRRYLNARKTKSLVTINDTALFLALEYLNITSLVVDRYTTAPSTHAQLLWDHFVKKYNKDLQLANGVSQDSLIKVNYTIKA